MHDTEKMLRGFADDSGKFSTAYWAVQEITTLRATIEAKDAEIERLDSLLLNEGANTAEAEARVKELDVMYESSHSSRMHAEDRVAALERELAGVREAFHNASDQWQDESRLRRAAEARVKELETVNDALNSAQTNNINRIAALERELLTERERFGRASETIAGLDLELAEAKKDTARLEDERTSLMKMLACWYFSSMRQGWESGHTESEVIDQIVDHMANNINPKWPAGYDLEATCAAIDSAREE